MTASPRLHVATTDAYVLAEGPCWDAARNRLLWLDIEAGLVMSGELLPDGSITVLERVAFDGRVGAIAVSADGDWLVAVDGRLIRRDPSGTMHPAVELVPAGSGRRINDGKPDPAGRFVVGTLRLDGPSGSETLALVDEAGIRILDDDLTLSNGLAWSVDGKVLYSVDTERRAVFRRPWDVSSGTSGERAVHLTFTDGYPDGMAIDEDDHLWIAVWGLGQVRRYSPAGALVRVIEVPAPHTSSVAFAGPALDTLVITTSHRDLDDAGRATFPDAGRLFTIRPGVRGAPLAPWSGRLPHPAERNVTE